MDSAIQVEHVAKSFGEVRALEDVSLDVPAGSIFGFLGPNGSGKTTTLRGLVGLMRFDAGTATMLGMDPWRDRVTLHARLGYLPSGAGMYPRMRGSELLDYAASLASGDGARSPRRAALLDALEFSKVDLRRPLRDYSKGMKQKLAIVQALQHDPELVLMDEPSEGLDPLMQHALYGLLRERAREGCTVLFSSHTLSEVEALCEHVAIIRRGRLVVAATLDELRADRPRVVRIAASDDQLARLGAGFDRVSTDHLGRAEFSVRMDPGAMLAELAAIELDDVVVEEPSLEAIFRSYYDGTSEPDGMEG